MRSTWVVAVGCVLLCALACLERRQGTGVGAGEPDGLYDTCESDEDCRGTGLICDSRRGCVECLDEGDCSSTEVCRRGLCEPTGGDDAGASTSDSDDGEGSADVPTEGLDAADGKGSDAPYGDGTDATGEGDDAPQQAGRSDGGSEPEAGESSAAGDSGTASGDGSEGEGPGAGGAVPAHDPSTECVLHVEAIFRDFPETHEDFGNHTCSALAQGALAPTLDDQGRPVLGQADAAAAACMSSAENFSQWYVTGAHNQELVKDLVLYDNGRGGFVTRFGPNGERYEFVRNDDAYPGGSSPSACEESCVAFYAIECLDACEAELDAVSLVRAELAALEAALEEPETLQNDAGVPTVEQIEADVAAKQTELGTAQAAADECSAACEVDFADEAANCAGSCRPCSYNPSQYCTGGTVVALDGDPLFFPVDEVMGDTADLEFARIPSAYGGIGWPWEDELFPGAPEHNFYFTTEVQSMLQVEEDTQAALDFLGDDDLWVFINSALVLDLGGVHIPIGGTIDIDAAQGVLTTEVYTLEDESDEADTVSTTVTTFEELGMEAGNAYPISIFHAERQMEGSSFRLTLTGFADSDVECPE